MKLKWWNNTIRFNGTSNWTFLFYIQNPNYIVACNFCHQKMSLHTICDQVHTNTFWTNETTFVRKVLVSSWSQIIWRDIFLMAEVDDMDSLRSYKTGSPSRHGLHSRSHSWPSKRSRRKNLNISLRCSTSKPRQGHFDRPRETVCMWRLPKLFSPVTLSAMPHPQFGTISRLTWLTCL